MCPAHSLKQNVYFSQVFRQIWRQKRDFEFIRVQLSMISKAKFAWKQHCRVLNVGKTTTTPMEIIMEDEGHPLRFLEKRTNLKGRTVNIDSVIWYHI